MKKCEKEEWWPIKGYEGWYEISTLGRIRSVDRTVRFRNGAKRIYKGQFLKFRYHDGLSESVQLMEKNTLV